MGKQYQSDQAQDTNKPSRVYVKRTKTIYVEQTEEEVIHTLQNGQTVRLESWQPVSGDLTPYYNNLLPERATALLEKFRKTGLGRDTSRDSTR